MKVAAMSSLRASLSGRMLQWGSELWGFHPTMFLWCLRPHVSSHHVHCEIVERGRGVVAYSSSSDEKVQKQLLSDRRGRFKDERACELVATQCVELFLKKAKDVERPRVLFTMPRRFVKFSDPVVFLRIANKAEAAGLLLSRGCSRMDCVCKLGDENLMYCKLRNKFPAAWVSVHTLAAASSAITYCDLNSISGQMVHANYALLFHLAMRLLRVWHCAQPSSTFSSTQGNGDAGFSASQKLQQAKRRVLRPRGQLVKQLETLHDLQPRANYDDFVSLVHGIR
eukprot:6197737-Pleurochrysis_carterae.AAC.4